MPELRRGRSSGRAGRSGSVTEAGTDAIRLILDYVKQETIGPLRGVARYVAFGFVGSLALSVGAGLLLLALLRALQEETGTTFAGSRSWLPYLVIVVVALAVLGLAAWRVVKGPSRRRLGAQAGPPVPGHEEV